MCLSLLLLWVRVILVLWPVRVGGIEEGSEKAVAEWNKVWLRSGKPNGSPICTHIYIHIYTHGIVDLFKCYVC